MSFVILRSSGLFASIDAPKVALAAEFGSLLHKTSGKESGVIFSIL